jgi:hypothetical protein
MYLVARSKLVGLRRMAVIFEVMVHYRRKHTKTLPNLLGYCTTMVDGMINPSLVGVENEKLVYAIPP